MAVNIKQNKLRPVSLKTSRGRQRRQQAGFQFHHWFWTGHARHTNLTNRDVGAKDFVCSEEAIATTMTGEFAFASKLDDELSPMRQGMSAQFKESPLASGEYRSLRRCHWCQGHHKAD